VAVGVVVEVGVDVNRIVRVWGVLPPRAQQGGARLPASKQSEAERYEINVFNHAFDAGQPQEVAPPLSADVRPPCAKRAVCAALGRSPRLRGAVTTTNKARRRQDGVRNGA